jgi:hypothetical protein
MRCHAIGLKECCSSDSERSCLEIIICSELQLQDFDTIRKVALSVLELKEKQIV